jgi:hypothetical protein
MHLPVLTRIINRLLKITLLLLRRFPQRGRWSKQPNQQVFSSSLKNAFAGIDQNNKQTKFHFLKNSLIKAKRVVGSSRGRLCPIFLALPSA